MRTARWVGTMAFAAMLLLAPRAFATDCIADSDCAAGEACLMMTCPGCDPDSGGECPPCMGECVPADEVGPGDECTTDADCGEGYICEGLAMPCASTCACECAECPDDAECPACECPPCEPEDCSGEIYRMCTPAPWEPPSCETDADCPALFTCQELELGCMDTPSTCACACPEGAEECPPCDCGGEGMPEPCDPEIIRTCVYEPADCESDADCGEGFTCVAEEQCMGGGCACPACADGEECAPCECDYEPPVEECEVTGHHCELAQVACESAADCPTGFICQTMAVPCMCPDCACAAAPPCADGEQCAEEMPACECEPCECEDATEGFCTPEGWDVAYDHQYPGTPGGEYAADGTRNDDELSGDDDDAEPPTTADDDKSGDDDDDGAAATGDDTTAQPAAGCSSTGRAGAPLGLGLGLVLLFGVVLFRRIRARG